MSMTDPIADFLTRIRNGLHAGHDEVLIPHSKMKAEMARILQEQGYIEGWSVERGLVGDALRIKLKYTDNRKSVISGLGTDLTKVQDFARTTAKTSQDSILGAISAGSQHALDFSKSAVAGAQDAISKAKDAAKNAQSTLRTSENSSATS